MKKSVRTRLWIFCSFVTSIFMLWFIGVFGFLTSAAPYLQSISAYLGSSIVCATVFVFLALFVLYSYLYTMSFLYHDHEEHAEPIDDTCLDQVGYCCRN